MMTNNTRQEFWQWFLRSGRSDGVSVSYARRLFNVSVGGALLVAWYFWMGKVQPFVPSIMRKVAVEHPFFSAGFVLAFIVMSFRQITLDYMAYCVNQAEHLRLRRSMFSFVFGSERKVREKYEQNFGRDKFYKAPERVAVTSVLIMVICSFALVFSR